MVNTHASTAVAPDEALVNWISRMSLMSLAAQPVDCRRLVLNVGAVVSAAATGCGSSAPKATSGNPLFVDHGEPEDARSSGWRHRGGEEVWPGDGDLRLRGVSNRRRGRRAVGVGGVEELDQDPVACHPLIVEQDLAGRRGLVVHAVLDDRRRLVLIAEVGIETEGGIRRVREQSNAARSSWIGEISAHR